MAKNIVPGTKGAVFIDLRTRFDEKVDRRGADECWPWLGSLNKPQGYGQIWIEGRLRRANQVAWELHYGKPWPKPLLACHACDNPPCVNPAHIFPGTVRDNIHDALAKGRLAHQKIARGLLSRLSPKE